ncbi:MAG TPA: family 16 glycoside hydrolase [Sedimentisphaerales bacterium]|nr:family 16 glycoside hydrolase [Sedimentisphaerales bacterium]
MNERRTVLVMLITGVLVGSLAAAEGLPLKGHPATDAYEGWRLGTQAYTFRKFTFYEAVDKTASLGLNWIEAYPGQNLSADRPDVKLNHEMPAGIRKEVKQKLAEAGVKLVTYGVVRLSNDETDCRKIFDFARDMGIETIVAEPTDEALELVDRLCKEYEIKVAIHNHPKPSHYWEPDKVLETCKGRSKWIGACADTGHWMRSGVNPLAALKKLEGRIISLHFKDLDEFGQRKAHDVVWGTGKADVEALLKELHRQGFEGVFSVEYEYNWDNSVPEIRQCVQYFNKTASRLKPSGWRDLLADDLSNCIYKPGSWAVEEGVLTRKGQKDNRGDIWTKERYGDFILDVEFMVTYATNSGIFFRTDNVRDPVQTGIEVQVYDSYGKNTAGTHDCGAVYDCLAPSRNMVRRPGEWNRCTIACKSNKIYVVLNGEPVVDMDLNLWTKAGENPDGTKNKYKRAYKDMPRVGHVGFQDHGHPVWYRNIRIKPL